MIYELFAKMDKVFSFFFKKKHTTLKIYWKNGENILEKLGNLVRPEKWEPWLAQKDEMERRSEI